LIYHDITAIAVDKSGNVWLGTSYGVSKFDGQHFTNFTIKNGLISNNVNSIAVDNQNTIWIGTGKGVSAFDGQRWTYYEKTGGKSLVNNHVRSVMVDKLQHKWFGTEYGVSEFYNGVWTTYLSQKALANYIFVVFEDAQSNIWFGTMGCASLR